jgi:hypothetical protein
MYFNRSSDFCYKYILLLVFVISLPPLDEKTDLTKLKNNFHRLIKGSEQGVNNSYTILFSLYIHHIYYILFVILCVYNQAVYVIVYCK